MPLNKLLQRLEYLDIKGGVSLGKYFKKLTQSQ